MKSIAERLTGAEMILYAARFMFDRFLTDAAGGNLSLRDGYKVYFSPTLAGTNYHWNIGTEDVITGSIKDLDSLLEHPRFTREGLSHIAIYKAFPYVQSILHAHPKYINPFVAVSKPIPALLNASKYFENLQYHKEADPYSQEQADSIVDILRTQEDLMKKKAAAVLMPQHGIILASQNNMMVALDCLERINNNAFTVLAQKLID
jgi:L-fuculose-phosphate aldolase